MDYYQHSSERSSEESSQAVQTSEPKKLKRPIAKGPLIFFVVVLVGAGLWLWMRNASTKPTEQPVVETSTSVPTQSTSASNTTINATTSTALMSATSTNATSTNVSSPKIPTPQEFQEKYEVRTDGVYYDGVLIKRAEAATFEFIGGDYAKDAFTIYSRGIAIPGANRQTFEYVGNGHAKDKNYIYNGFEIFSAEDPSSFEATTDDYYKRGVSFRVYLIPPAADPQTVEHVGCFYTKDDSAVYFYGKTIVDADPATFSIVGGCYPKDSEHVYLEGKPIPHADPNTFEYLGLEYTKDADHAYFYGDVISGADATTFEYVGGGYAKDTAHVYLETDIVPNVDPASCTIDSLSGCKTPKISSNGVVECVAASTTTQ
jgi:hypothetical protein